MVLYYMYIVLVLLERINKMGVAICDDCNLPSPLSVAQPSLVCDCTLVSGKRWTR